MDISRAYRKPDTASQRAATFDGGVTSASTARAHSPGRGPGRRTIHRTYGVAVLLVLAGAAALAGPSTAPRRDSAAAPAAADERPSAAATSAPVPELHAPPAGPASAPEHSTGSADQAEGAVPDGTSVFDDDVPGVGNLEPDLLAALRAAADEARSNGVRLVVDSGWRSPAYQEHLRRQAVANYGSAAEAARWVASPQTSLHVSGDAVDLGPADARRWLAARGATYGLCRVYDNEPWHFELRREAIGRGCPATYADPTHDPRLRP